MLNKKILIVLLVFGLSSCDFILPKKQANTNPETFKPIDFTSIDAYPLLPECADMSSRTMQKRCFYSLLSKRVEKSLRDASFSLSSAITDTIFVTLQVSNKGILSVTNISLGTATDKKQLKALLSKSFSEISPMQPAIKSGIPVTSEFRLPIIVSK